MGIKPDIFVDGQIPKFHDYHVNGIIQEINNIIKWADLEIDDDDFTQLTKAFAIIFLKAADADKKYLIINDAAAIYQTIIEAVKNYISKNDMDANFFKLADANKDYEKIADAKKTYLAKVDAYKWSSYQIGNTSTNTDLNTITSVGWYNSSDYGNKFTNRPPQIGPNGAFVLWVQSIQNNTDYIRQTIYEFIDTRSWTRVKTLESGKWSDWYANLTGHVSGGALYLNG